MYRALVSFCGRISMTEGEVRDISDKAVVKDLLDAKFIEEVNPQKKAEKKPEKKEEKKPEPKAEVKPEEKPEEKPKKRSRKKTTKKK